MPPVAKPKRTSNRPTPVGRKKIAQPLAIPNEAPREELLRHMDGLRVQLTETREQLAYVYGALEEIAQRQEMQASWQIDVARRLLQRPAPFANAMADLRVSPAKGVAAQRQEGDPAAGAMEQALQVAAEDETSEAFDEILASADMLFKKLSSRSKTERVRGLKAMERILKRHNRKEKEPMFIVLPAKMDLH
jgi:hypothetical protein